MLSCSQIHSSHSLQFIFQFVVVHVLNHGKAFMSSHQHSTSRINMIWKLKNYCMYGNRETLWENMKINMCFVFTTTQTFGIVYVSALFSGQLLANQDEDQLIRPHISPCLTLYCLSIMVSCPSCEVEGSIFPCTSVLYNSSAFLLCYSTPIKS